ncbi:MAG: SpoIID/LytB domain-containing protein [Bacteroidales bacterium]
MSFRLFCLLLLLLLNRFTGQAIAIPEIIEVGIFSGENVRKFSFTPLNGRYMICDKNHEKLLEVIPLTTLIIEAGRNGFTVSRNDTILFTQTQITLQGAGFHNSFVLKPLSPNLGARSYDGDLKISQHGNNFRLINATPLESYVAGTVQWESGFNRHNVFYQVQAIIIRTYALRNLQRHQREGFHLCDKVHCQAYYGRTTDPAIILAVEQTRGEVVTDTRGLLLNTVYHANCGGETVNSEDLWPDALPYLRSRKDTYCQDMPGARWQSQITTRQLKDFLQQKFSINPGTQQWERMLQMRQPERIHHLDDEKRVHLRHMREHFALRSTWFSIETRGDTLHLSGRGYGHGVGLCQEGAIQRAARGYNREQILRFYYQGATIRWLEPEIIF